MEHGGGGDGGDGSVCRLEFLEFVGRAALQCAEPGVVLLLLDAGGGHTRAPHLHRARVFARERLAKERALSEWTDTSFFPVARQSRRLSLAVDLAVLGGFRGVRAARMGIRMVHHPLRSRLRPYGGLPKGVGKRGTRHKCARGVGERGKHVGCVGGVRDGW